MKKFFILPVLAVLFTACTNDELVVDENKAQQTVDDGAIVFDAYITRAVTRAGKPGNLTTSSTDASNISLQKEGFGVFAYYANGDLYSENAIPDFMYNQQVNWESTTGPWKYAPIKYWPNEFGSSAISTGVDRLTFFAYAPYVTVEPSTGQLTSYYDDTPSNASKSTETGITALTRNGKTGDPYVRYVAAFNPDNCVDLCYGVAAADYNSAIGAADGANSVKKGEPYLNIAKPELNSKIYFDFKHALAKLNVKIDADVDIAGHAGSPALNGLTRIWVRSITFDGIAQRGYLNLNSGMWYDVIDNTKISHASVTVYDGQRDDAEAIAKDSYETPIGLNENLVQSVPYETAAGTLNGLTVYDGITTPDDTHGVTATPQNLFAGTTGNLLVIPANEQLKVTIVYDVETADATLSSYLSDGTTKGSTVENKITKSITLDGGPLKLEAGKAYTLNLHLGMNSVKFDAAVSDWEIVNTSDVDLPANVPVYPARPQDGTNGYQSNPKIITFPWDVTSYSFAISGLKASETVNGSVDGVVVTAITKNAANASGLAVETATLAPNTKVTKTTGGRVTVAGTNGSGGEKFALYQDAHPLGLTITNDYTTQLGIHTTALGNADWSTNKTTLIKTIKVWRNGALLTENDGSPDAGQFQLVCENTSGKIGVINYSPVRVSGDVFTVTMQVGDAPEETFTIKIP